MVGSNKNYLNMNLLVFIPEMEISKLNSMYNSLILYIARCVYGAQLGLEFSLLINTKLLFQEKIYTLE